MVTRWSLGAFAVVLIGFAVTRTIPLAFVLAPILGFTYFVVITSLSTVLQEHLDDAIRGRIMALWIMSFGGTVPLGVLAGGFLVNAGLSITAVLVMGAVVALLLAWYCNLVAVGAPGPSGSSRPQPA